MLPTDTISVGLAHSPLAVSAACKTNSVPMAETTLSEVFSSVCFGFRRKFTLQSISHKDSVRHTWR